MAALDGAIPAIIGAANAAGGSHQVDRSLRFNSSDSSYLSRSQSSGNSKTFTYSFWLKAPVSGTWPCIIGADSSSNERAHLRWNGTQLQCYFISGGNQILNLQPNRVFRDKSAWYHIVLAFDTTQSTASDRAKLYVNGTQESSFEYSTYPSQDATVPINNSSSTAVIGRRNYDTSNYFSGYLAEVHFVDGTAHAPTDFGEEDSNGVWQPIDCKDDLTYGTNGFYLKFADNSSNSALGTDSSGNGNNWTVNNLNVGAVTYSDSSNYTSDASYLLSTGAPFNGSTPNAVINESTGAITNSNSRGVWSNTARTYIRWDAPTPIPITSGVDFYGGAYNDAAEVATLEIYYTDGTSTSGTFTSSTQSYMGRVTGVTSGKSLDYVQVSCANACFTAIRVNGSFLDDVPASANDSLIDTPTNYEADSGNNGGNYCTLNPLAEQASNNITLSNGNLTATNSTARGVSFGTLALTGKTYWEVTYSSGAYIFGMASADMFNTTAGQSPTRYPGQNSNSWGIGTDGSVYNGSNVGTETSWTSGDVMGWSYDSSNGAIKIYKNGSLNGSYTASTSNTYFPAISFSGSGEYDVNFGQRPFAYTPPTDHKSLCTQNLTEPVIGDGSTAFNATLYTGNGSARNISTPYGPDFVWIKSRGATYDHGAFDVLRGANQRLNINSNGAEATEANSVTAFNSDSFSLGSLAFYNNPSTTFVAWNWNAGTSTESNTDGSITSQVRANTTAGFSIVSFTGDGSGTDTIGHGLNDTPSTIWLKDLDNNNNWLVYTTEIDGSLDYLSFNQQSAKSDSSFTAPTSSVFSYGTDAADYIAYCFAPVEGYSTFGTYAGNQSSDGPFIYTGFRPRFVMVKVYDQSDNWVMWDSSRGATNVNDLPLYPNLNNSETTNLGRMVDFLSNGFKLRSIDNSVNGTHNYLYWAFAEHPINTARAR